MGENKKIKVNKKIKKTTTRGGIRGENLLAKQVMNEGGCGPVLRKSQILLMMMIVYFTVRLT